MMYICNLSKIIYSIIKPTWTVCYIAQAPLPCSHRIHRPQVGFSGLEGSTTVRLNATVSAEYPANFAAYCEAWDNGRNNVSCQARDWGPLKLPFFGPF